MDLRRKKVVATLVYPKKDGSVWLAKKTRKIGIGQWNGWGGAQEKGETIRQAALREFQDESKCHARIEDLEYVGKVTFHNQKSDGRKFDVEVHMFLLREWEGDPRPTPEMIDPTLWPENDLPFNQMMASDPDWLPLVLRSEWIDGDTWQKWIEEPDQSVRVVLTRPTEIRKVDKLGGVD